MPATRASNHASLFARTAFVAALGAGTIFICSALPKPSAAQEAGVILQLPETVIGMPGQDVEPSEGERAGLPPDTQFAKRLYKSPSGEEILCQIVLSGADRRSIHRPEACLRGQGWKIENGGTLPVPISDGRKLDVMELVITRPIGNEREKRHITSYYLYWFVSKDTTTPYHWQRIFKTDWDLLTQNVAHRWAYVIVSAPVLKDLVPGGKNEAETLDMLKRFISEAAPQFQKRSADSGPRPGA